MLAAPLTTKKIDSPILSHFSKAKFFVLTHPDGDLRLLINNADSPEYTLDLLKIHGVTTLFCPYLTQKTLEHAQKIGIHVFDCGRVPINFADAKQKYINNALKEISHTTKRCII